MEQGIFRIDDNGKTLVEVLNKNVHHIVVPNTVTEIGDSAFDCCYSLESIDIPYSVKTIGRGAFFHCHSLKSIIIPNSVVKISSSAFMCCYSLQKIDIPNSVKEIGYNAFMDTEWYNSQPDGFIYINNLLYKFKGEVKTNPLVLREGTVGICECAFAGCHSLKSIDIPNSVEEIGDNAFYHCESIEAIDLPNSITKIGASAFSNCYSLQKIDIPNSVVEIGNNAFEKCISLDIIDIPNSVMKIDDRAFGECTSLTSIDIPDSVKEIGEYAFCHCTSLKSINIPDTMTGIGNCAFVCSALERFDVTSSIFEIGELAIGDCPIAQITVDVNNPVYFAKDDVLYKHIFDYDIEVDKNVLVRYAPKKMEKRFKVDMDTLMIDSCAFKEAKSLEEIVLHDNIFSLGKSQTFASCTSLKEIRLPASVNKIPHNAFDNCSSLQKVILPNSNNYIIESFVFEKCTSLKAIHSVVENIDGIIIDNSAFEGFNIDECTLYVPSGTRWAYRHHKGFGKFKNIEIEPKQHL